VIPLWVGYAIVGFLAFGMVAGFVIVAFDS
jgi:hypothetical protein